MRRREFIGALGAAAAWPLAARAQQTGKVWRLTFLTPQSHEAFSPLYAGFVQGMRDLGYVEGRDFIAEFRTTDGDYSGLPNVARELVGLNVDILLTGVLAAALALKQMSRTIPIIVIGITDPVGNGLISTLARPGGNITGLASSSDDTLAKQLELLAAVVSNASRIGFLGNPNNPGFLPILHSTQEIAAKANLFIVPRDVRNREDIESAFEAFSKERVQALIMPNDPLFTQERRLIADFALKHRLPSTYPQRDFPEVGGLMSYGEKRSDSYRRAASYVDKVIKGAKPGDLPVEQPTRFHLVINRKTADALGVTIPPVLYIFADEVIE